jgi:hypothetical protein
MADIKSDLLQKATNFFNFLTAASKDNPLLQDTEIFSKFSAVAEAFSAGDLSVPIDLIDHLYRHMPLLNEKEVYETVEEILFEIEKLPRREVKPDVLNKLQRYIWYFLCVKRELIEDEKKQLFERNTPACEVEN